MVDTLPVVIKTAALVDPVAAEVEMDNNLVVQEQEINLQQVPLKEPQEVVALELVVVQHNLPAQLEVVFLVLQDLRFKDQTVKAVEALDQITVEMVEVVIDNQDKALQVDPV